MIAARGGGLWVWDGSRLRKLSRGQWAFTADQFQPGEGGPTVPFFPDSQNSITQLLEDEDGNLWGGTYAGLFRASTHDLKQLMAGEVSEIAISVYGRFNGLPGQGYSGWFQPSCWRARDGRLWFTTVKEVVAVNPREVVANHRPPPVVVEEIRVDGLPRALPPRDKSAPALQIEPGRHYLEFRFTGIDFIAPGQSAFQVAVGRGGDAMAGRS
jgi:hypothetical protein